MREKLIELLIDFFAINEDFSAKMIADYLLENGVVVLPCKVGDVVYCIEDALSGHTIIKVVKKRKVNAFGSDKLNHLWLEVYNTTKVRLYLSDFGKTALFTKEEAEKAIERSKQ